ncbi:hypothetical protein [Brachybacterium phenoliresistens]|uniref:hypothetical protein n=1 Tax=Brachybacterium phenoliresistens TaxID=396014 RepID=UPI0031D33D18
MVDRLPFPLLAERPAELEGIILDFHWDLQRLHGLHLPSWEVRTATLRWHLELPFWPSGSRPFQVTPLEVAADPGTHAEQWRRTMAADLRHPLDAYVGAGDRLIILDGVHRLLRAEVECHPVLRVRVIDESRFDEIAVPA